MNRNRKSTTCAILWLKSVLHEEKRREQENHNGGRSRQNIVDGRVVSAPQLNISQKALGTLPEDGNVMPKHVGATIHN
jgi:hypothetical protein